MFRKGYLILGIVLLIIDIGLVTMVTGNPFFVFVSPLDIMIIIFSIIVIFSGFIQSQTLRTSLVSVGILLWAIVIFFAHFTPRWVHTLLGR